MLFLITHWISIVTPKSFCFCSLIFLLQWRFVPCQTLFFRCESGLDPLVGTGHPFSIAWCSVADLKAPPSLKLRHRYCTSSNFCGFLFFACWYYILPTDQQNSNFDSSVYIILKKSVPRYPILTTPSIVHSMRPS
jgi:hypothetical protein